MFVRVSVARGSFVSQLDQHCPVAAVFNQLDYFMTCLVNMNFDCGVLKKFPSVKINQKIQLFITTKNKDLCRTTEDCY